MAKTGSGKLSTLMVKAVLVVAAVAGLSRVNAVDIWQTYTAPIDDRVADLLSKLTVQEKISLRNKTSPAITRLGIGSVQWWTEMQNGRSTIFPAAIGKACTWDQDLMLAVGKVYGDEARRDYKKGQQFYSPAMVNLAMDPRAGRNDEGWGEDPYLGGTLAAQLIRGAQGNREYEMPCGGEYYIKVSLMAKHLIGNNHENNRYNDVSLMDERDFYEWFLPPFKTLIDADVGGVMCGLNPITIVGNPQVQNVKNVECAFTLDTILRTWWGWKGYTTGDCGGVNNHPLSLERGIDGECQDGLEGFFDVNTVNKTALDRAVGRLLRLRFRMGEFDPASACPYQSQTADMNANAAVALQAAREAVVLAKNANNILPIDKSIIKDIVLIGPVAAHPSSGGSYQQNFFGGYSGWPSAGATNLQQGLQAVASANNITLTYIQGMNCINSPSFTFSAADQQKISAAQVVIVAVGTENNDNRPGGNGECNLDDRYPGEGRDLVDINLPGCQEAMAQAVYGYNKKVVVVVQDQEVRSAPFIFDSCPGVIISLTGGQAVGKGLADVIFGDFNPSGRTAQTWMRNIADYPDRKDYRIREGKRTYWYFDKPVFFPFGHGLSYTMFTYSNVSAASKQGDTVAVVSFSIKNSGARDGAEIAELYIHALNPTPVRPIKQLRNFKRVTIAQGAIANVSLAVTKNDLSYWSATNKSYVVDAGRYEIQIGSTSQDIRLRDTITYPVGPQSVGPRQEQIGGKMGALSRLALISKPVRYVFADSRTSRYLFEANNSYDIYTCSGKKVQQFNGEEAARYFLHAPRGIYIVKEKPAERISR